MSAPIQDAAAALARFALSPASARPLATLRVGIAAILAAEAVQAIPAFFALYGEHGVIAGGAPAVPGSFHHVITFLGQLGVPAPQAIGAASGAYLLALAALLVGYRTRPAAGAAWLLHALLLGGSAGERHGADELSHMALFYLMWMPSGDVASVDRRRGRAPEGPTPAARLALRVLQLHLCLVQGSSGIEKARGEVWRNGEAIWKALMLPEFRRLDFSFLASHPWLPTAGGWAILLFEIAYPILVWPRRTRLPWVVATSAIHLGIAALMGLTALSAVMILLTVAAFGVSAEPARRARA